MSKILIIDDDLASCRTLQLHLTSQGQAVTLAHSADEGLAAAVADPPELVILDIRMPGKSGLEVLPELKQRLPQTQVIMITAFHDMESTIEAMQKGAEDYIHKPIDIDELDTAIDKLLCAPDFADGLTITLSGPGSDSPLTMVGRSREMKEVFKTIGLVAKGPATVLISGESGTGKELVARAIHRCGGHPDGPLVAVNCAALVETLLESDMFGHEKGSFTGAVSRQIGKFALARDGTIFLDEVGELSPSMQAKLLRVLQYKEFTPLGAKETEYSNARVITATNVDLGQKVADGGFREDLFYRLQVVNIHLPPLRERGEDIVPLVQTLLARINRELNRNVSHVSAEVMSCLERHSWPGNVRELENVLMKGVALCPGNTLTPDLLPEDIRVAEAQGADNEFGKPVERWSLEEIEKVHVRRVLQSTRWHRGQACEVLGVSRPRLRRMMRQFGITPPSGTADDENGAAAEP
ncbi:MAG: sigma-54 dependent transcriptional regulator [Pseudomonadota bacterium]|nr:sigma-54 dependent transcriptional regulator [Pseudomonadota bacterium]